MNNIAIYNTDQRAVELSVQLNLPLVSSMTDEYDYLLVQVGDYLQLHCNKVKKFKPLCVDFLQGKAQYRRLAHRQELLAKAIGNKKSSTLQIIDATAGLGGDSFVLASLGYRVTLIERVPILAALLQDGLFRAAKDQQVANIIRRMSLKTGDANQLLATLPTNVIYLDPMYPQRNKRALVKKEMRILRDIVGDDLDAANLLAIALQYATRRVVVKRPRLAEFLDDKRPDFSLTGKACRFDIYLTGVNHV